MNKKSGSGAAGKSSSGLLGKSSGGKSSKPLDLGGKSGKSPGLSGKSSGDKGLSSSSYTSGKSSSKSGKSSTSFGIIWLPSRKNKQKKDLVYNPHKDERSKDRAPSMYNIMSGDSSEGKSNKKEEHNDLLGADRVKVPLASATGAGLAAATQTVPTDVCGLPIPEEKQGFIQRDRDDSKEAAGDAHEKNDSDYLEHSESEDGKSPSSKSEKNALGDKVDSVYLRPPPPHKARSSNNSAHEEEDCGVKCLYYTLQCCDCVLQ